MTRAKAAKLSETSSTPRSRSASMARTTRNSVRPFGVSRSRRIDDSDIAGRPYEGTKCRNPRIQPPQLAVTTTPPASRSVRSESIDIEKPRSAEPASQRAATCSSAQSVASSSSDISATCVVKPAFSSRATDWRTFRIARPSSENRPVSTIASSPM
jgi:hypothetical protein